MPISNPDAIDTHYPMITVLPFELYSKLWGLYVYVLYELVWTFENTSWIYTYSVPSFSVVSLFMTQYNTSAKFTEIPLWSLCFGKLLLQILLFTLLKKYWVHLAHWWECERYPSSPLSLPSPSFSFLMASAHTRRWPKHQQQICIQGMGIWMYKRHFIGTGSVLKFF